MALYIKSRWNCPNSEKNEPGAVSSSTLDSFRLRPSCTPCGQSRGYSSCKISHPWPTSSITSQQTSPWDYLDTTNIGQTIPTIAGKDVITDDKFISTCRVAKESTSSSPSSHHIGHYKAIFKDPTLVHHHATMMFIPFQVGIVPERWKKVTDIMLEKTLGNARCHHLRIIVLFESDLNHATQIIIGRQLMHHLEDTNTLTNIQFGSGPGKHCSSAVLNKVFCHHLVRITKKTAAFIENNAIGC